MRKFLFACVAVVLVIAGGLIALLGPRHCPINRAAFGRIEKGMTQAEVRAIMGPTGDHRTRPSHPDPDTAGFDADITPAGKIIINHGPATFLDREVGQALLARLRSKTG